MIDSRIQRSAALLLAGFMLGALLLPFAHEFTHIRSLEHVHGKAAADVSKIALGPGGLDAVDFLVEERTVPHTPACTLCARLAIDAPTLTGPAAALAHVDGAVLSADPAISERDPASRQIRAPPPASEYRSADAFRPLPRRTVS